MSNIQIEGANASKLVEVHRTFTAFLFSVLGQNPRWSQQVKLADTVPTKGKSAKVKMGSRTAGVHEWLDERVRSKLTFMDHEIVVKRWANAISVDLDDLDDDDLNLALYRPQIAEMADDFDEHKHQVLIDLLGAGFAATLGLCYDGQYFFDTDHPLVDGSTQSNKGTAAFSDTALYAAIKAMEKMKKPNGLHANVQPTHGIFPSALRSTVDGVLAKRTLSNGSDNPLYQRLIPIFDPRLDAVSETAWFVLDAAKMSKPFWWADRQAVTTQYSTADEFEHNKVDWGGKARYQGAYGTYQVIYGSTGAS